MIHNKLVTCVQLVKGIDGWNECLKRSGRHVLLRLWWSERLGAVRGVAMIGTASVYHGRVGVLAVSKGQKLLLHDALTPFLLTQLNPAC